MYEFPRIFLQASAHGRMPEVKQAAAMLQLDGRRAQGTLDSLRTAAEAAPGDHAAIQAYAVALSGLSSPFLWFLI